MASAAAFRTEMKGSSAVDDRKTRMGSRGGLGGGEGMTKTDPERTVG